jgi:hypothetical protein
MANDIKVNTIFRVGFNCTWYNTHDNAGIHVDHEFPHKNFIMCINSPTSGDTVVYDKDNIEVGRVKPEQYKAVVFSGDPHTHEFCAPDERRVILVATFN